MTQIRKATRKEVVAFAHFLWEQAEFLRHLPGCGEEEVEWQRRKAVELLNKPNH